MLPNLKQKSLERNNSVFSRRDLIKKEYNKIMEHKLPNILNLMNNNGNAGGKRRFNNLE